MAQKSGEDGSLAEITQRIAHSRDQLGRDLRGLRYELDFPLKIRKSFQRKTVVWISAAVVLGLMFGMRPARKKIYVKPKKGKKGEERVIEAGLLLTAVKLATDVLKPVVISYIMQKVNASAARAKRKW
jgi:hypothetical protein